MSCVAIVSIVSDTAKPVTGWQELSKFFIPTATVYEQQFDRFTGVSLKEVIYKSFSQMYLLLYQPHILNTVLADLSSFAKPGIELTSKVGYTTIKAQNRETKKMNKQKK